MKLRFILNPCSGRNRQRPWLAAHVRTFIRTRGLDATLVVTERAGHATELARAAVAEGCDRVIAIGGDGTLNEVAQGLVHSPAALALVPCGSGNGLALHLHLPRRLSAALALAADPAAPTLAIDTGTANGHPFFNVMGTGFDADVSRRFNRLQRRGLPAYLKTGLAAFCRRRTQHAIIRSDGAPRSLETFLITVANSDQYGNNARIAPGARVDDGRLDLIALPPVTLANALPLIARLFFGRIHRSPHVVHLRDGRFAIERARPGLIHTDGEVHRTGATIDVRVLPRSLRLVIPATTADALSPRPSEPHCNLIGYNADSSPLHSTCWLSAFPSITCLPTISPAHRFARPPTSHCNLLGYRMAALAAATGGDFSP